MEKRSKDPSILCPLSDNCKTDLNIFAIFDLWEDNIAVISPEGLIIYTNQSWKRFAEGNGLGPAECSEGTNYLKVCNEATGENSTEASCTAKGIIDVINGNSGLFKIEYPCYSPDERRWFLLKVTPL